MFCNQFIYKYDHINDNSCQHRSADYWVGDTLGELKCKSFLPKIRISKDDLHKNKRKTCKKDMQKISKCIT